MSETIILSVRGTTDLEISAVSTDLEVASRVLADITVEITAPVVEIEIVSGPRGPSGDQALVYRPAAEAIGGHRAIVVNDANEALYADPDDAFGRFPVGVSTGAAAAGAMTAIQTAGVMVENGWNWLVGLPVWLGSEGMLTQLQPTSGAVILMGHPSGPKALRINPQFLARL